MPEESATARVRQDPVKDRMSHRECLRSKADPPHFPCALLYRGVDPACRHEGQVCRVRIGYKSRPRYQPATSGHACAWRAGHTARLPHSHPCSRTPNATLRELRIGSRRVTFGEPLFQTAETRHPPVNARIPHECHSRQARISQPVGHFRAFGDIRPTSLFASENPGHERNPWVTPGPPDSGLSKSRILSSAGVSS